MNVSHFGGYSGHGLLALAMLASTPALAQSPPQLGA